jgi:alcohol dehydrogenase
MYRILCRVYQFAMRVASALVRWREPRVVEGEGCVLRLPEILKADGVKRPLLVTGPTLSKLGVPNALAAALDKAGMPAVLFSRVDNDPTIANVEDAYACYRANRCDAIIALGGGSPIDCAKLCGARVARPNRSVAQMKGMLQVRRTPPPLYAVPTTAGTGSEATLAAMVSDEAHRKFMVGDPVLVPLTAVLDPTLTRGMPASVTAASGMDALTHAVEAYIGRSNTAATRAHALEAVKLVFTWLARAYEDGGNMEARKAMQKAAYRAGLAITRANVGYAHAVAHGVGGRYGLPHGLACGVALPAVLRAYGHTADQPLAMLADAAGIPGNGTETQRAEAFIAAVAALAAQVGLPAGFTQLKKEDIPALAAQAAREGNRFYPAPKVLAKEELAEILRKLTLASKA